MDFLATQYKTHNRNTQLILSRILAKNHYQGINFTASKFRLRKSVRQLGSEEHQKTRHVGRRSLVEVFRYNGYKWICTQDKKAQKSDQTYFMGFSGYRSINSRIYIKLNDSSNDLRIDLANSLTTNYSYCLLRLFEITESFSIRIIIMYCPLPMNYITKTKNPSTAFRNNAIIYASFQQAEILLSMKRGPLSLVLVW